MRQMTVVRNSLPDTIFEDLRGFSGFGQIPGITPDGITDIQAVITRSFGLLKGRADDLAGAIASLGSSQPTYAKLADALVAMQGIAHGILQRFEADYANAQVWRWVPGPQIDAVDTTLNSWADAIASLRQFLTFLGGPADKLKKHLRAQPATTRADTHSVLETTRQLLAYSVQIANAYEITTSVREAMNEASVIDVVGILDGALDEAARIVDGALDRVGRVAAKAAETAGKAAGSAGKAAVTAFGGLPWWVWVGGGLFLYVVISRSPAATGARTVYRRLRGQEAA